MGTTAKSRKLRIFIIADPHIAPNAPIQRQHLDMAIDKANALKPDFVVLPGDVTDDGRKTSYDSLRSHLSRLQAPCFVLRGNNENQHSRDQRFEEAFGRARFSFRLGGTLFVVLDTSSHTIDDGQLRWLRETLRRAAGMPTVVLAHHYVECLDEVSRSRLISTLNAFGVRALIAAHQHRRRRARFGGVTQFVLSCLDPDKSKDIAPGCYLVEVTDDSVRTRFVPITISPALIEERFLDCLGYAPAGRTTVREAADFCLDEGLKWLQLRLTGNETRTEVADMIRSGKRGVETVAHLPTLTFDSAGRWMNRRQLYAALSLGANAGSSLAIIHPPKVPAADLTNRRDRLDVSRPFTKRVLSAYRDMLARCSREGIRVSLENNSSKKPEMGFSAMPWHLTDMAKALDEDSAEPIGYCFDIGHAKGSRYTALPYRWIHALQNRLWALHLHTGIASRCETHHPVEQLYVDTNWYGLAAATATFTAGIPALIEVRTTADAKASLETLRTLARPRS